MWYFYCGNLAFGCNISEIFCSVIKWWCCICSLVERRKQWHREEKDRQAREADAEVPAGHRLMPDDERLQTLNRIQLSMSLHSLLSYTTHQLTCDYAYFWLKFFSVMQLSVLDNSADFYWNKWHEIKFKVWFLQLNGIHVLLISTKQMLANVNRDSI